MEEILLFVKPLAPKDRFNTIWNHALSDNDNHWNIINSRRETGLEIYIEYMWDDEKTHEENVHCVKDIVLKRYEDIKFGDFIVSNRYRYRNDESYFWDGTKCISWEYNTYDDYGCLPAVFKCIDGQSLNIYSRFNTHNNIFWPSDTMRRTIKKYPFIYVTRDWKDIKLNCIDIQNVTDIVWSMYLEHKSGFYFVSHRENFPNHMIINEMDCYSGIYNNKPWTYDIINDDVYITMF